MSIEVHILSYMEQEIMPYTMRHYASLGARIILHDSFSTDRTREIAKSFGADVRDWDTGGKLNDALAARVKNEAWHGTDADWVIVADADELIYFPNGCEETLKEYDRRKIPIVKTHGFEMFADKFPTTAGQIYHEVKFGAEELAWYSKPSLFSPKRVKSIQFGMGAHDATVTLKTGRVINGGFHHLPVTEPETYLLHCHHIRSEAEVAARYDTQRSRLSALNVKNNWGNTKDSGIVHAKKKRALIIPRLQQVIA